MRVIARTPFLAAATALLLSGCAAQTAIQKADLAVENRMSKTVFLEPVSPAKRVIYVEARNTSDRQQFSMEPELKQALTARGYTVTDDPDKATFLLQVNVLQVGRVDGQDSSPLGDAALGGAVGAGTAAVAGQGDKALIGGALAGAALGGLMGVLVEDITYALTTDIRISQRTRAVVQQNSSQRLPQGMGGADELSYSEQINWKRYETKMRSTANQANLDFETAIPALRQGMVTAISGLF